MVVISSYLPEILGLADHILVWRQGRMVEEFTPQEAKKSCTPPCTDPASDATSNPGENNDTNCMDLLQERLHEGDLRILGAASHATWLSLAGLRRRRPPQRVAPDLDHLRAPQRLGGPRWGCNYHPDARTHWIADP